MEKKEPQTVLRQYEDPLSKMKKTVAANIAELRRINHMTQAELADKLCYSDKAISKWERGESIPDVFTLKQVADLFCVTVDYLLADHDGEKITLSDTARHKNRNHILISCISAGLVWLIATMVYVILGVIPVSLSKLWMIFIYAVPVTLIVILVFNSVWGRRRFNYLIISLLMWSVLTCLCLQLYLVYPVYRVWLISTIGVPGQVIICLWSGIKVVKDLAVGLVTKKDKKQIKKQAVEK